MSMALILARRSLHVCRSCAGGHVLSISPNPPKQLSPKCVTENAGSAGGWCVCLAKRILSLGKACVDQSSTDSFTAFSELA